MVVAVALLAALVLAPVGFLAFGSLRSAGPGAPRAQFTFDNWRYIVDGSAISYIGNSLLLGVTVAVLSLASGVAIAWLIARTAMPGRRFFSSALLVPLLFSPVLTTIAWVGLAGPDAGLVNSLARNRFGFRGPVFDIYSLAGIVFVLFLHFTPYVYVAVRSALLNMDRDLEDASRLLGAGLGTTLRRVTLPLIAPAIVGSAILVFVLAAEEFAVPAMLGVNFGFLTVPYGIYEAVASAPSRPGRGSAFAIALMLLAIGAMYFYLRSIRSSSRYVTVSGKGPRGGIAPVSRAVTTTGVVLLSSYLLLSVVLPYLTLLLGSFSRYFTTSYFSADLLTLEHYQALLSSEQTMLAARNTFIAIAVGATVTILFSAFIAWISVRGRWRMRRAVDYLAAMPIMIPGVALGMGMLWAYIYIPTGLYGTLGILLLAYLTRYMGHGNRILSSALLQVNPELEEAAHTLGSSRLRTFVNITLPLLRVPLASAWVLVAIFISLEVAASVFLFTSNSITMAVTIWLNMERGVASSAFAAAAVLATATFVLIFVAQWRFRVLERL